MIMLGKTVSYGGNTIRYDMEKDHVEIIKVHNLPDDITPTAMWDRMKLHQLACKGNRTKGRPLTKGMMTFVISPTKEESEGWTKEDWDNLTDEAIEVLDSIDLSSLTGRKSSSHLNLKNSQYGSSLHIDSKSGIKHLHICVNRIDMEGNTNDDHKINIRAMRAAEIINQRHGWVDSKEIRQQRNQDIVKNAVAILNKMNSFNFDVYFNALRDCGYVVSPKKDSNGEYVNYSVKNGSSYFKSSELGRGKHLTVAHLKDTWKKLHPQESQQAASSVKLTSKENEQLISIEQTNTEQQNVKTESTSQAIPNFKTFSIDTPKGRITDKIPTDIVEFLGREATVPEDNRLAKKEDIINTAVLLFLCYVDAATSISESCGGGGSSITTGWRKKDDEDDWQFARRCLAVAHTLHKPRHRGRHR